MSHMPAARLGDPIEHSSALGGLLTGLIVGATLAVAAIAIAGTGGLAAVAMVGGLAAAGAGVGEVIGSMSFAMVTTGSVGIGSGNVLINLLPAARAHIDVVLCSDHPSPPPVLAQGSITVLINGMPAARQGELAACSGKIAAGSSTVLIGGDTVTTDEISPEVPPWLHTTLFVVGLGSAVVFFGPVVAIVGLGGGFAGGYLGSLAGGAFFGADSDGQKASMLLGSFIGGFYGTKGGMWGMGKAMPGPTTWGDAFLRNGLGTARTLEYQPTSRAKIVGEPGKTTTVLGNYGKDTKFIVEECGNVKNSEFGDRPGDIQYLNVPDALYKNGEQFWTEYNRPWLDQAIKRGDRIILVTEPTDAVLLKETSPGKFEPTGFGREFQYMKDHGYVYDPVTKTMSKSPE